MDPSTNLEELLEDLGRYRGLARKFDLLLQDLISHLNMFRHLAYAISMNQPSGCCSHSRIFKALTWSSTSI